jgi:predicted hydrocarbon binding protein
MDDIVDSMKRAWTDLRRGARELGETTTDRLQRYRHIQDLNTQIKKARARREELHVLMGRKVYALHKKGKVANKDLLKQCEEIDELVKAMEQCQQEIDRLKAEPAEEEVEVTDESPVEGSAPEAEAPGEEQASEPSEEAPKGE